MSPTTSSYRPGRLHNWLAAFLLLAVVLIAATALGFWL